MRLGEGIMKRGWISIHRQILDNPLFVQRGKASKIEAWIYLLLKANHRDADVLIGMEMVHVKKGQLITSQLKLCKQFKWGNSKLRNYLKLLEKQDMITVETTTKLTCITICNYSKFQDMQTANKLQTNSKRIANNMPANTNNNVNKSNNVNKKTLKDRMTEFNNKAVAEALKRTPSPHPDLVLAFCNYWTEHNEGGSKMKFEKQKVFNIAMRLNTWILKSHDYDSNGLVKNDTSEYKTNGRGEFKVWCSKCNNDLYYKEYHLKQKQATACCGADIMPTPKGK